MRAVEDTGSSVDFAAVRLSPGSHSSPGEGACVVELASLIARERFSDRPRCVCPVIAAFLRGWNDRANYVDRRRLRPYAERIVGSRGDRARTRQRRLICIEWAARGAGREAPRRRPSQLRARLRIAVLSGLRAAIRLDEGAGELAARAAFSRGDHEGAFELLERLLPVGGRGEDPAPRRNGRPPLPDGWRPAELPVLGVDPALEDVIGQRGDAIEEEDAVEVVDLVLNGAGLEAEALDATAGVLDDDSSRAPDVGGHVRQR
jgi:hypothetical protein